MVFNRAAAVLFLFGATIASAQFIHELSTPYAAMPRICPPAAELAPLICKFMQHNTQLQYKPQFIAPSTYIPHLVVEKCDNPQLQMEIDLPMPVEENKPMLIPDPPVLPPITLPRFPVPVMIEEPILPPVPDVEPCEPAFVPEMPVERIPVTPTELPMQELPALPQIVELPEVKELEFKPMAIPQPPELPTFVMPELPVRVAEPTMIIEPCPEGQPMQVMFEPEYIQPLSSIPAAPELPTQELPVLPEIVELPEVDFKPMAVPQPPELPAFVMPEFPVRVAEPPMIIEPCPEEQPKQVTFEPEYFQPLASIAAAPELPPQELPTLPEIVELPEVDFKTMAVPQPPELPAFMMPEFPVRVAEPHMIVEPCPEEELMQVMPVPEYIQPLAHIPAAPELPPASLPELPVRVEIPTHPMIIERPVEEPCITGEVMVPNVEPVFITEAPRVPQFIMPEPVEFRKPMSMPILPTYPEVAIMSDPCEPSSQPIVKMAELPPYFVRDPPYVAVSEEKAANGFRLMENIKLLSLPYMRRV